MPSEDRSVASTVADAVSKWALRSPHTVAISARRGFLTAHELAVRASSAVTLLRAAGVRPDDVVFVHTHDAIEATIALVAISTFATALPVPIDIPRAQVVELADRLRPCAVVGPATHDLGIPCIRLDPETRTRHEEVAALDVTAAAGRVPLLLTTSGSSARPKIVEFTHENLRASALIAQERYGLQPGHLVLVLSTLTHALGLRSLCDSLWLGGGAHAVSSPRPEEMLPDARQALRTLQFDAIVGPPATLTTLARLLPLWGVVAQPGLRFIRSGSAAISPKSIAAVERTFGVPVVGGYGTTEATKIAVHDVPPAPDKSHTVGRPTMDVRVVDGLIEVRGPGVSPGYRDDPAANAAAFAPDGWFRTRDTGFLDADGYLVLTGRADDVVNRGGELIVPATVEAAIADHPDVREVAVVRTLHPTLGEDLAALVVLGDPTHEREVRASLGGHLGERLATSHQPSSVYVVDQLPRLPSGKIDRAAAQAAVRDSSMRG